MKDITKKEMELALAIFKSPEEEQNASSISKRLDMTRMGALKIMKKLEKQGILESRQMGKATFYKIDKHSDYASDYLGFMLKREAEQSSPYIKRWISDIKKIKNADIVILFGSVLKNESKANDIDVLFVTEKKKFTNLKKEVARIDELNEKKMHPIYQTDSDLEDNVKKHDKMLLNAIKGIVIIGQKQLIEALR
ncbi:MAG: winged helix-turn-helix domain-containing protein [Candidatus Woesearchaeota archaeon]|nr:winged helix-turn-helix domain-containing protein [Candidatus Woesearchaeota archaeon]